MAVIRTEATPVAVVGMELGEGPIWVRRDDALWFVDIKARTILSFDPADGRLRRWSAPGQVGWIVPTSDGEFLVGLQSGLHRFDPVTGAFALYREIEPERPHNRLNDATVDMAGRLWFGTMDDGEAQATGRLYCLDKGTVSDTGLAPICITNGPAISADGRTLYAVDTLGRSVDALMIGPDGALAGRRRFLELQPADGFPDGAVCDAEGGIWLALYQGCEARRYGPDGAMTDRVAFPVSNVTKIALGGPDGRTAYATTARKGLNAASLAEEPHAGDLFSFRVTIPGIAAPELVLK